MPILVNEVIHYALKLGRATLKNIKQNIGWAFVYNIIGIPIAAAIEFNPAIAALCMSLSSVCVVTNALRINRVNLYDRKEKVTMEKTIKVEGMMCTHCEAAVEKALTNLPEITEAKADHENGTVTLTMNGEAADADIKEAVKEAGYEVI